MLIRELKSNQVFVFGSNINGFHGAGAAGYASFGESGNVWRKYNYVNKPNGWKGKWNVKGVGEGLQEGIEGMSYALPTVVKPGYKRSIRPEKITENIKRMYECARLNRDKEFLVSYDGKSKKLLSGYSIIELAEMFRKAGIKPVNVIFEKTLENMIKEY